MAEGAMQGVEFGRTATDVNQPTVEGSQARPMTDSERRQVQEQTGVLPPKPRVRPNPGIMQKVASIAGGLLAMFHPVSNAVPVGVPTALDKGHEVATNIGKTFKTATEKVAETIYIPTEDQKRAALEFDKPNIEKFTYVVTNNPEITQMGGLAVRNDAGIALKGDTNIEYRLQPGSRIENAILVQGRSTDHTPKTGTWIAFKDEKGHVVFVNEDSKYVERVTDNALASQPK